MFILKYGTIQIRNIIHPIKPYTSDKNVEDITPEKYAWQCQHIIVSYIIIYYIKAWKKLYNWIRTVTLMFIPIGHVQ